MRPSHIMGLVIAGSETSAEKKCTCRDSVRRHGPRPGRVNLPGARTATPSEPVQRTESVAHSMVVPAVVVPTMIVLHHRSLTVNIPTLSSQWLWSHRLFTVR